MKVLIAYENEEFKATIPFQKIIDLFELTDEQIEAVNRLVLEAQRMT